MNIDIREIELDFTTFPYTVNTYIYPLIGGRKIFKTFKVGTDKEEAIKSWKEIFKEAIKLKDKDDILS